MEADWRPSRVHVLGHPDLPMDTDRHPEDAQVRTCETMAQLLARAAIPFVYYGLSGSRVPAPGVFKDLGEAEGKWAWRNHWHESYSRRLQAALAETGDRGEELVLSLYGAAHADVDAGGRPVIEPMVGYDHCWAPYRVFPSYAQQHVLYTSRPEQTWRSRWFDTVIPHFLDPTPYAVARQGRGDSVLFLGRDAPDKGVDIARAVCRRAGVPLRAIHRGLKGEAKIEAIARSRAVIMPTVYVEPFGYVAVEAQLCGVPVIATDWGAFAETVEHGLSGFRCRTEAEFVWAIHACADLPPEPIRARALRKYSIAAVLPAYLAYFRFVWAVHTEGGFAAPHALRWPCCSGCGPPPRDDGDRQHGEAEP